MLMRKKKMKRETEPQKLIDVPALADVFGLLFTVYLDLYGEVNFTEKLTR